MAVTVLAIADQVSELLYDHFSRDRWDTIDLILSCGDLPPDYLDFLSSSLNVPLLYVRGNHDARYEVSRYDGFENVHGRIVTCKGLRVAGFEGSRRYTRDACQHSEGQMWRLFQRLRWRALWSGPPEVVLAHAPPAGCHDGTDQCHRGFATFRQAIEVWRPAFFVHGHTHAYDRQEFVSHLNGATVINAYPYHVFQVPVAMADREIAQPDRC